MQDGVHVVRGTPLPAALGFGVKVPLPVRSMLLDAITVGALPAPAAIGAKPKVVVNVRTRRFAIDAADRGDGEQISSLFLVRVRSCTRLDLSRWSVS
jgi:hypothetical protein